MIELRTNDRDWLASSPDDKIAVEPIEKGWPLCRIKALFALVSFKRAFDPQLDSLGDSSFSLSPDSLAWLWGNGGYRDFLPRFFIDRFLTFMDTPHLQVIKRDGKDGRARMIETICFFRWVELSSATIEDDLPWQSASKGKGYRNKRDKAND